MRKKGLSVSTLGDHDRLLLKAELERWYVDQGLSQGDIAELIGNKTSGYVSWLFSRLGVKARDF